MIPLPEERVETTGYLEVVDVYISKGVAGGSSHRLQKWIDEQRARGDVRVLVATDYSHLIAAKESS